MVAAVVPAKLLALEEQPLVLLVVLEVPAVPVEVLLQLLMLASLGYRKSCQLLVEVEVLVVVVVVVVAVVSSAGRAASGSRSPAVS